MTWSRLCQGFMMVSWSVFYLVVFLARSEQSWSCSSDSPPSRLSRRRCTGPCPRAAAGWGSGTTRPAPSLDPSDLITVRGSESQPTAQVTGQWRYDYNTRSMPFLTYISESGIHRDTKDIATRSERHYRLYSWLMIMTLHPCHHCNFSCSFNKINIHLHSHVSLSWFCHTT